MVRWSGKAVRTQKGGGVDSVTFIRHLPIASRVSEGQPRYFSVAPWLQSSRLKEILSPGLLFLILHQIMATGAVMRDSACSKTGDICGWLSRM